MAQCTAGRTIIVGRLCAPIRARIHKKRDRVSTIDTKQRRRKDECNKSVRVGRLPKEHSLDRLVRTCSRRIPPSDFRQLARPCQCIQSCARHRLHVLLHEHPPQRVSNCMRLIMNLIRRGGQIWLCTFQLQSMRGLSEQYNGFVPCTHNPQLRCSFCHYDRLQSLSRNYPETNLGKGIARSNSARATDHNKGLGAYYAIVLLEVAAHPLLVTRNSLSNGSALTRQPKAWQPNNAFSRTIRLI